MENLRTNIISNEVTQDYIKTILEKLSNTLSKSLGPYGSTTIIQNEQIGHFMTKDGFTILKSIRLNDPISMTILQIIQDISTKLVMKVGDGSTSSIIAAQCLYEALNNEKINEHTRPKEILDKLNDLVDMINDELMKYKKDISDDMNEIEYIASISLNNDIKIGKLIADIYRKIGKGGFINIKLSDATETYYEQANGFQIDFGYLDKILVNTDSDECRLLNSNILMFNGQLDEDMVPLITNAINVAEEKAESLTIIAPNITSSVAGFLRQVITYSYRNAGRKGNINIIQFPLATECDENSFFDLSVKVGATIVQNRFGDLPKDEDIYKHFGKATEVISNYKTTSFLGTYGNEEDINVRIGNIVNELKLLDEKLDKSNAKRYELQKRLAVLENKLYTIYIGGKSEHAKLTDKYLIEDAIAACKSAIKYGYVIGGNLAIPICIDRIIKDNEKNIDFIKKYLSYCNIIKDAFKNVYFKVLNNKYDNDELCEEIFNNCLSKNKAFDLISEMYTSNTIINSVETEIEILKNVTSIISLLILSNQFITINANY